VFGLSDRRAKLSQRDGILPHVRTAVVPVLHTRYGDVAVVPHNLKIGLSNRRAHSLQVSLPGIYARGDAAVTHRWTGAKGGAVDRPHHRPDHRARLVVATL
jgi:hypothetical protein